MSDVETMRRTVTRTARFGTVITYHGEPDINGYLVWADNTGGGDFAVCTDRRTPDDSATCGHSFKSHGSVKGGRGVTDRILALGREAIAAGRAAHDPATCGVCKAYPAAR